MRWYPLARGPSTSHGGGRTGLRETESEIPWPAGLALATVGAAPGSASSAEVICVNDLAPEAARPAADAQTVRPGRVHGLHPEVRSPDGEHGKTKSR